MSYALIDNASLTAVERVLGNIVIKNTDTINGDLVAFENLIQAILFYDRLFCIDNYKYEYKKSRAKKFDFIKFLSPDEFQLSEINELGKESELIRPEIRGGEFADEDFKRFLEALKMNIVCTWDMCSSIYYLTMKMLGQPYTEEYGKYSELSAAIFNELFDVKTTSGRWANDVTLIGSNGHKHTQNEFDQQKNNLGGITIALEMFIASLNWLAFKSIYYSLAANYLRADTFIHPIRHAYQIHWMKKTGAFEHDFTSRLIRNLSEKISSSVSEIKNHGRSTTLSLDLPIFSAWLTRESGSINNILQSALELRKSDHFLVARETVREIRIAFDEYGVAKGNKKTTKLISDLDKITGDLKRSYGIPSQQGIQGSFLIKTINTCTAFAGIPPFPDRDFALSTPEFLQSEKRKAFSMIFKNIANELTAIERLGSLHTAMASSFKIGKNPHSGVKTENPIYSNRSSNWKLPM